MKVNKLFLNVQAAAPVHLPTSFGGIIAVGPVEYSTRGQRKVNENRMGPRQSMLERRQRERRVTQRCMISPAIMMATT